LREAEAVTVDVPGPVEDRRFDENLYIEEREGALWLRQPLVHLGMVGVRAFAPLYRLGPEAARALAPLVTRTRKGDGESFVDHYAFRLPDAEGPVVLLRMGATVRLAGIEWGRPQRIYEVAAVRDLTVEFLTAEWLRAFADLDAALTETVEATGEPPGEAKRRHLEAVVARGSADLEAMGRARATGEMRAAARAIDPGARIVRSEARRLAGAWGGWLRRFAGALGLEIPAPLAGAGRDALDLLAAAGTPEGFVRAAREREGEDSLDEGLLHSASLGRMLSSREIGGLDPEGFGKVRDEARKALEERRARDQRESVEPGGPESWEMPAWGVRLGKAGAQERARALILRGTVVEEVLPGGSKVGLERGDIIIDAGSVHDVVMGGGEFGSPKRLLDILAESGGRLRVIRGDRALAIAVPKGR